MKYLFFLFPYAFVLMANPTAHAEVAIRHVTTSEIEFQALAQALGYSTIAEVLVEKPYVAKDMLELFELRLSEAQNEWSKRRPEAQATPAIDRFLDLSLEADWSADERAAFINFTLRKIAMDAKFEIQGFARIATFIGSEQINFSEMPQLQEKWRRFQSFPTEPAFVFQTNLPNDIVAAVVNGRVLSRQDLASFSFSKSTSNSNSILRPILRVTFISNTYQPTTILLNGSETDWPAFSRTPWMADDCKLNAWNNLRSETHDAIELKPLGYARCAEKITASETTQKKVDDVTAKFGISRELDKPIAPPASNDRPLLRNPWFWGAVGVLAVGAVVAMKSEKEVVRPTVQESW